MSRARVALLLLMPLASSVVPAHGYAEAPTEVAAEDVEATNRQNAAHAYDRGVEAFRVHDYATAAHWFDMAYQLAPAAAALVQSMRAYTHAGNEVRAATVAARLIEQYPDDHNAMRAAHATLEEDAPHSLRLDLVCEDCTLDIDGNEEQWHTVFVAPGTSHTVVAHFPAGNLTQTVQGNAGDQSTLRFEPPTIPVPHPVRSVVPPVEAPPPVAHRPFSPTVFWVAAGATAVATGLAIWSGVDTQSGVAAYNAHPTLDGYNTGHGKEIRTDIFIGVASALAVGTAALGIFGTNWHHAPVSEVHAGVAPMPGGAAAFVEGRF